MVHVSQPYVAMRSKALFLSACSGAVVQSVERATTGEEVMASIPIGWAGVSID